MEIGSRTERQMPVARKREIEPIGENAGQKATEPKEMPADAGALPLVFFHWRVAMLTKTAESRAADSDRDHERDAGRTRPRRMTATAAVVVVLAAAASA